MHNKKFFYLLAIPFLIIFCVQMCLINADTRDIFTNIEAIEGVAYNYVPQNKRVYVELELAEGEPSADITVMYNAREVMRFTEQKLIIPVDCDGVFQIQNNTSQKLKINAKCKKAESVEIKTNNISMGITTFCFVNID